MSNTICQYLAEESAGNGRLFSYCLESTKCDMNWKPSAKGSGRSMLEQADECAKLNLMIASMLKGEAPTVGEGPLITDSKEAAGTVMKSAMALSEALKGMQDSQLDAMMQLPFGTYPAKFAVSIANSNMVYHWGQANYIELLDGDTEFRIPPEFISS